MKQSRLMSLIEAGANVVVGYVPAIATQRVVFPLFGIESGVSEHLTIGPAFVAVSLARGYALRRLFERWLLLTPPKRRGVQRTRPDRDGVGQGTCYALPMFGLLNLFGRSAALKALEHALREAGLHPLVVAEPVKITIVRLKKEKAVAGAGCREATYAEAAQLLAYCMLGRDRFIVCNSVHQADRVEHRLEAAIAAGDSPDAKLILLAHHSGVLAREIAERLEVEDR
jgi:hypothetical protein